jgi:hypothetical protein
MVASATLSPVFPTVIFLVALTLAGGAFASGLLSWIGNLDPWRPRTPVLKRARLRRVPPEPPAQVHELAYNCVICGRPLTNPQSMKARVGSTCIRTYGPRFKLIANPEHARWRSLVAAAEAERAAEQARLNVAHARALDEHGRAIKSWESERASVAGQERLNRRQAARHRMLLGGACAPIGAFVGMAAVVPFT